MTPGSQQKLRICHIAATTEGATWMIEQLRELRDAKGYEVSAIIAAGCGALAEKLEREGIPFSRFDFEFPAMKGWRSLLNRVVQLALLLRRERYDVVQTHLFASMVLGRLAAWLADVPVRLAMVAGPYHLEAHTPRWIDSTTLWMETGLIASCEYTRTLYRGLGVPEKRLSVIYYGPDETKFDRAATQPADLHRELGLDADAKLVGMVAYFYPRMPASRWTPIILHDRANKRQEDLIRATPAIVAEFPEAKVLLIGSGWGDAGEKELESAKRLVEELSLQGKVLFTGFRGDVNNVLAAVDVAVQASLSENLGGTIEALLMECPTVATRTGGMVDSVRDGETGVLVKPLDPEDLAGGVTRLLRDPGGARQMARNGRQLMLRDFTLHNTVDALDRLYSHWLKDRSTRRGGYRVHISLFRMTIAFPVFAWLALRLALDTKYLPRWDLGWRPFPIPQLVAAKRSVSSHARIFSESSRRHGNRLIAAFHQGPPALISASSQAVHAIGNALARLIVQVWRSLCRFVVSVENASRRLGAWMRLQPLYAYGYVRYLLRDTEALRRWDVFFAWIRGRRSG